MEAFVANSTGNAEESRCEAATVARAARGDAAAFGELYVAHLDAVYHHVLFRVRDPEAAAEISQEVFVKAFRALTTLRRHERFRAWLLRIAHNAALNYRRREADAVVAVEVLDRQPSAEAAPEDLAGRALDLERVTAAAAGLTELQRQVIALRFISGLTVAETASILGRQPNAVHNLQHHALAALRRRLAAPEGGR